MGDALIEQIAAGDAAAHSQLLRSFTGLDRDGRASVLNQLAAAAGQSSHCLQALLRLLDDHRLADPAIRSVLSRPDHHGQLDDVHQDVMLAVSETIERFEGRSAFTTWLWTIARNKAIDHLRRNRGPTRVELGDAAGASVSASSMIASQADLVNAINRLVEPFRSVVLLRDVEHRSYDEIARQLTIDLGTVKSRLSRGRGEVRRMMAELVPPPAP